MSRLPQCSGLLCMKSYCSLLFFSTSSLWLNVLFLYVQFVCVCVCVNICACACTRHLHACVPWDMVLSVRFTGSTKNGWNDIQSSDIKHQRPRELWCIDRLREQRERWLRGWKSWKRRKKKKRDRWSRQKTSSPGSAADSGVWASGVYVSQDLEEKLLPWEQQWRGKESEGCKGVCGAPGGWMRGDVNQVPSWPSCQSIAFPSAPLQYNSTVNASFLFFSLTGLKVRCCSGACMAAEFPSDCVCSSKLLQLWTGTCLDVDE